MNCTDAELLLEDGCSKILCHPPIMHVCRVCLCNKWLPDFLPLLHLSPQGSTVIGVIWAPDPGSPQADPPPLPLGWAGGCMRQHHALICFSYRRREMMTDGPFSRRFPFLLKGRSSCGEEDSNFPNTTSASGLDLFLSRAAVSERATRLSRR